MKRLMRTYRYHNSTKVRRVGYVMIGELVNYQGQLWVVTGSDPELDVVYIANGPRLRELRPSFFDMHWEEPR